MATLNSETELPYNVFRKQSKSSWRSLID